MSAQVFTITIGKTSAAPSRTYTIPVDTESQPWLTVLDVLEAIKHKADPDLVYRHSCHHGSCGTCSCIINGIERLVCLTRLEELPDNRILLEPLQNHAHLGGIAAEAANLFRDLPEERSVIRPSEINSNAARPDGLIGFSRFENCIECGACVSACPEGVNFVGPFVLASIGREVEKSPERIDALLALAAGNRGVDGCIKSYNCSKVCPTKVYPSRLIDMLRELLA